MDPGARRRNATRARLRACRYLIALRPYGNLLVLCVEVALSVLETTLFIFAMLQNAGLAMSTPASVIAMIVVIIEVRAGRVGAPGASLAPGCCQLGARAKAQWRSPHASR